MAIAGETVGVAYPSPITQLNSGCWIAIEVPELCERDDLGLGFTCSGRTQGLFLSVALVGSFSP